MQHITNHFNANPSLENHIDQSDFINELPSPILQLVLTLVCNNKDIKEDLLASDCLSLVCKNFNKNINDSQHWKDVANEIGITILNQNYRRELKKYISNISKNHLYKDIIAEIGLNKFFLKNVKIVDLKEDPYFYFNIENIFENANSQFMVGRHSSLGNFIASNLKNNFIDGNEFSSITGQFLDINFYFYSRSKWIHIKFSLENPDTWGYENSFLKISSWKKFIQLFK